LLIASEQASQSLPALEARSLNRACRWPWACGPEEVIRGADVRGLPALIAGRSWSAPLTEPTRCRHPMPRARARHPFELLPCPGALPWGRRSAWSPWPRWGPRPALAARAP